jgi:GNAT superfamily N-acetyltransferase
MLKVESSSLDRMIEDGLETLMYAHWIECSIDREAVPFDPDWNLGRTMERCGVLKCFALRDDGELVGYSIFEVSSHLNFKTTTYAWNNGIYVRPESRKGNAGIKLIVESERWLKADGVKKFVYLAPSNSALNDLLVKDGYRPSETYYTKLAE